MHSRIELPAELESKGLRGKGCRKRVLFGLASVKVQPSLPSCRLHLNEEHEQERDVIWYPSWEQVYALGIYKAEQDDKQTVFCISMARDLPGEKVLEALKERFDSYGVPESDSKQLEPVFAEKVRKGSTLVIATDRIAGTVSLRWSHGQGGSRPTVVVSQSLCDAIVDSYLGADPAVPRAKEEFERSFCPAT